MNYQRIYNQIVDRAKQEGRKKGEGTYYESHHILPKCLGGSNKKENLVLLTGREHFLLHWMLVRIYPENSKLIFAFWGMCNQKKKGQEERHTPGGKAYEEARELFSENHSKYLTAFYQTEEGREVSKRRVAKIDYRAFQERKVSSIDFVTRTANTDYKARTSNTDYEARTAKMDYVAIASKIDYEAVAKKNRKAILQFTKDQAFIKEWTSVKEAGETLKIQRGNISICLKGKGHTAGGYIWKYKDKKDKS